MTRQPPMASCGHSASIRAISVRKRGQPGDARLDVGEMRAGDGVCPCAGPRRVAGERDQVADRVDAEAEVAGMADEPQPAEVLRPEGPPVRSRPVRPAEQADLLVIADRRHLHAALRRRAPIGRPAIETPLILQSLEDVGIVRAV